MARILVIDDEDIVRKSISQMLESEGHDKDGLEIIRELRPDYPLVKFLAITGGGATGNLDFLPQAKAFGAHATLRKPFLREDLLGTIADIM